MLNLRGLINETSFCIFLIFCFYFANIFIMPIYEYRCSSCGEKNSFFEKRIGEKKFFWDKWFDKKRCKKCNSKKLERILSCASVHKTQTTAEMLNDLSKIAPINFVPDTRIPGPPPGGCPYAPKEEKKEEKKRERIIIH